MPLSSTHRITRTLAAHTGKGLAALSIAAVALAGCSGGTGADSQPDAQGQNQQQGQQGGSDGGGQKLGDQNGQGQDQQGQPDTSDVPDPVATVNGEKISKDEFVTTYTAQYQQASMQQQQTGQKVDDGQLKKQVAQQLVGNHLLLQAADKAGIKATDKDVDTTLDDLAQQNGLGSADELVKTLGSRAPTRTRSARTPPPSTS
jgi:peptidyl-prolyl cis-trans isomerase SurA